MSLFFSEFVSALFLGVLSLFAIGLYVAVAYWLKGGVMGGRISRLFLSVGIFLGVSFAFGWTVGAVAGAFVWALISFLLTRNARRVGEAAHHARGARVRPYVGASGKAKKSNDQSSGGSSFTGFGGGSSGGAGASGSY